MGPAGERGCSASHACRRSQLPAGYFVQHFRDELNDVGIANDRSEEEIRDEGGRDRF